MKKILSLFTALILFGSMTVKADITIKGKIPSAWTNVISVYLYGTDADGFHAAAQDGDWWSYTYTGLSSSINAIFVNGEDWGGDANQTVDITGVTADACYQISANGSGKCSAVAIDCSGAPVDPTSITIKGRVPSAWTNVISVYLYGTDADGFHAAAQDGDWWSYTYTGLSSSINAIFVNGEDWGGDANQTVDITGVTADACYQISANGSGKCSAAVVDCSSAPVEPDAFVAGSEAEIFGTTWDASAAANQMTWDEDLSKYKKVYTVDKAYKSVALKVVYDGQWYGEEGGEDNVKFSLSGAGEFVVYFNKATHHVTVSGPIVGPEQFDFGYVTVTGNGTSGNSWVNGANWDATAAANRMTEVSTNVYEISFDDVEGTECQFQFTFDGSWTYQFGGTFDSFGTATTAVYGGGGGNIVFTPAAGADVTIRLDLSGFNFVTKEGATFTVSQVAPEPDAFVAGSVAEIFGTTWDASAVANQMTWDEDLSKYKKVYTVDKAYKSVALKVVYDNQWYGVEGGDGNVKFSLSGAGTFTVLFDKTTHYVTLDGAIVSDEQFDFEYVAVAGNGISGNSWLNGANWDATATANRMTEVSTNVYEISFNDVDGTECQFQFTFDGGWDYQFGGTFSSFGAATTAVYGNGGGNIVFTPTEGADITIRLDLSGFDFATKEGATFTVSQVAPTPVVTVEAKGEWDGWTDALAFVPDGSGLTATATLANLPAGNYAFKLIVNDNWLSNENAFHRFWTSASGITENLDNMELQADADGDYIFTWTFATNAIEITFPSTPKTGTNEVKFFAPRTEEHPWDNVYVYAWRRTAGEDEPLLGAWPGALATKDGEWYKATVDKGACVIFHDNAGMQSFDIENVQKDACYVANAIDNSEHEADPEKPIKAKFYESCTVNFFLTGDEGIMGAGNAWVENLAERQLDGNNSIELHLAAGIYEFKLTNGSWAWSLGGKEHLNNSCSNAAATTGSGNVKFKLEDEQDVTISYNPATQKICLDAETVLPYEDVRAGLTDGNYYTVCFNREMKQIRGASLWSFIGRDADFAYIVQESAPFAAGKPFVIFAESEKLEAVLDAEVSAPVANGALHGTFTNLGQADLDGKKAAAGDKDVYLVIGNELRRATGASTGGNSLPAYRAYVIVDEIDPISTPNPAPGKNVRSMPMHKDATQGFENIEASDKPMKLMIDGQLYILRGEKVYDATGRMVK